MAMLVGLFGASASGKTTASRPILEATDGDFGMIQIQRTKMLPYRPSRKPLIAYASTCAEVQAIVHNCKAKSIMIDDAQYLMIDTFMARHRDMKGNAQYDLYNDIADDFYNLIRFIGAEDPNKIVYFTMHEEKDDYGNSSFRLIGKLLRDKISIEGMLSIVLQAIRTDAGYYFTTQNHNGKTIAKSPIGMFPDVFIPNDLLLVDTCIRKYCYLDPLKLINTTQEDNQE